MKSRSASGTREASFYFSPEHACSYLPGNASRNIVLDPLARVDQELYQGLIDIGYRRSGSYLYRPACPHCDACIALRLPARDFIPNRSQRRCRQDNDARLEVTLKPAEQLADYYPLFQRYIEQRHPDGAMQSAHSLDHYIEFLSSNWSETVLAEFSLDRKAVCVAVIDRLPKGLSAVYTFYEPDAAKLGLGNYAVLWQIEYALSQNLPYLYLGYWIAECGKMNYKERFRPVDAWDGLGWLRFEKNVPIEFAQRTQEMFP